MGRMYIDAITLLKNRPTPPDSLDAKGIEGFRCCLRMYNAQIEKQIANRDTDVVEVRHGTNISEAHPVDEFICSECGLIVRDCCRYEIDEDADPPDENCCEFEFRYCPRCGVKIDD